MPIRKNDTPPVERISEALCYEPKTGVFRWRPRPGSDREANRFNSRYAGKPAGNTGGDGYIRIRLDGDCYKAHRLAWKLVYGVEADEIDHINRDRADNRIANLRSCTRGANQQNYERHSVGTQYCPDKSRKNPWIAHVMIQGRTVRLGSYATKAEAHAAYRAAKAVALQFPLQPQAA